MLLSGVAIASAIKIPVRMRIKAHQGREYKERHEGRRKNWLTQLMPDGWPVVVGITDVTGRTVMKSPEKMNDRRPELRRLSAIYQFTGRLFFFSRREPLGVGF